MDAVDPTKIALERDACAGVTTHGNMEFSAPWISLIQGNIYQGGCENGLVLPPFIKNIVSLYPWERWTVEHDDFEQLHEIVMYDSESSPVDHAQLVEIAELIIELNDRGPVLVHCQAGLNRSSLCVGAALVLMGSTGADAIELIRKKRSSACLCNRVFEQKLRTFSRDACRRCVGVAQFG